jgi:outer membrane protein, heavy metal efflux system
MIDKEYYKTFAVIFILIFLNSVSAYSQSKSNGPNDSLRLEQVVQDVLAHNDRIAAARYMENSARLKAKASGAWDDPMLMLGVQNLPTSFDFNMDDMTMKMIELSQNIPYAGQKGLESKAAGADANLASADRAGMEIDLIITAKIVFYDLYYKALALEELQKQKQIMAQIVASVTSMVRANQAGQDDMLMAQTDLWRLDGQILSAEQELDEARFNLNTLCGLPPNATIPAPAAPIMVSIPDKVDLWLEAAAINYPGLQKLFWQSESYRFSAAAMRRMRYPMLGLSAGYGLRQGTGMFGPRDNMLNFKATLSLPIFNGRAQGKLARSMDEMKLGTLSETEQLRREVKSQLYVIYWRAKRLAENLDIYESKIIPSGELTFQNAFSNYSNSRISLSALLNQALALSRDKMTLLQLKKELSRTLALADKYITPPFKSDANIK